MEGIKKLHVTQEYGLRPLIVSTFLNLYEPVSKERAQTKAHIQEKKRASTSMMKILRMLE